MSFLFSPPAPQTQEPAKGPLVIQKTGPAGKGPNADQDTRIKVTFEALTRFWKVRETDRRCSAMQTDNLMREAVSVGGISEEQ